LFGFIAFNEGVFEMLKFINEDDDEDAHEGDEYSLQPDLLGNLSTFTHIKKSKIRVKIEWDGQK
jgi:hypothetical protein